MAKNKKVADEDEDLKEIAIPEADDADLPLPVDDDEVPFDEDMEDDEEIEEEGGDDF